MAAIMRFHLIHDDTGRAATIHVFSDTHHKVELIEDSQIIDESGPHETLEGALEIAQAFIHETASPDGERER